MSQPQHIDPNILTGERLALQYIPLDQAALWDDNPRAHQLDEISASITEHGFRDPMAYDATLSAFVEGHGRTHALRKMRDAGADLPRGVAEHPAHGWCIPVLFGVDARSQVAAQAYAVAHNQLTMNAGWDDAALLKVVERVQAEDETAASTMGISQEMLNEVRARVQADREPSPPAPAPQVNDGPRLEAEWRVEQADILEWLRDYDGPRFHAVFCDPPYGLAFMGKEWDAFKTNRDYQAWVTEWATLLIEKALYPGAVVAFFGGTRTVHRLACGLEDAGFEISDGIACWVYGSGFPKSLDISKAIDKEAGAEREVIGDNPHARPNSDGKYQGYSGVQGHDPYLTVPATPDAARWDGYGTALKPAHESCIIARAPRAGLRYVDLVLQYGTGTLNIDGARITTSEDTRRNASGGENGLCGQDTFRIRERAKDDKNAPSGRWPANVILSHHPDCERVGERRVKPDGGINETGKTYENRGTIATNISSGIPFRHTDADGMETVEVWNCVEGCPVKTLGEQSGETTSSGGKGEASWDAKSKHSVGWQSGPDKAHMGGLGDTGTAARFFYTAKASRAERDAGLGDFPHKFSATMGDGIGEREHNESEPSAYVRNGHPCIKPIAITEYIARLLLPPPLNEPRRVLIPFCGSGSEMIGAMRAGWDDIVGVEMDAEYAEIAQARLEYWQGAAAPITEGGAA